MPIHHVVNGLSLGSNIFNAASRSRQRQRDTEVIHQQPSVGVATFGTAPPPNQPMGGSNPNFNQYYNASRAKVTAIAQIVAGCITCSFGIAFVVVWRDEGLAFTITGILAGVLFLSSGIVGIYAASRRKNGLIVGYLVLSIISSVVAGIAAIWCTTVAVYLYLYIHTVNMLFGGGYPLLNFSGSIGGLAIVFYIECILAVIASGLGCCGLCCTPHDNNNQMNVIQPNHPCGIDVINGPATMVQDQSIGILPNTCIPVAQVQSVGPTSNFSVVM